MQKYDEIFKYNMNNNLSNKDSHIDFLIHSNNPIMMFELLLPRDKISVMYICYLKLPDILVTGSLRKSHFEDKIKVLGWFVSKTDLGPVTPAAWFHIAEYYSKDHFDRKNVK